MKTFKTKLKFLKYLKKFLPKTIQPEIFKTFCFLILQLISSNKIEENYCCPQFLPIISLFISIRLPNVPTKACFPSLIFKVDDLGHDDAPETTRLINLLINLIVFSLKILISLFFIFGFQLLFLFQNAKTVRMLRLQIDPFTSSLLSQHNGQTL